VVGRLVGRGVILVKGIRGAVKFKGGMNEP
jgi:hypothetical protein